MLSFYFTIAANQEQVTLDLAPGHQHPARILTLILNHPNPQVQEHGKELARNLSHTNPALLRRVIQRLDAITSNTNGEQPEESRAQQILSDILESHSPSN